MCYLVPKLCRHSASTVRYTGVVGRISEAKEMATRPVVTPEAYSGDGPFDAWIEHFERAAALNEWSEELRAQWLAVRLIGRAQIALRSLPAETVGSYTALREALRRRFEPESKRDLYAAEFHVRQKQAAEDWATFGEDLKALIDKAFPGMEAAARERLAVDRFLTQLTDPQLAFSVRQKRPETIDEVVTATLEMQAHLSLAKRAVGGDGGRTQPSELPIAGTNYRNPSPSENNASRHNSAPSERFTDTLQQLVAQMEKLESALTDSRPRRDGPGYRNPGRRPTRRNQRRDSQRCYRCRELGHIARNCPAPRSSPRTPGN